MEFKRLFYGKSLHFLDRHLTPDWFAKKFPQIKNGIIGAIGTRPYWINAPDRPMTIIKLPMLHLMAIHHQITKRELRLYHLHLVGSAATYFGNEFEICDQEIYFHHIRISHSLFFHANKVGIFYIGFVLKGCAGGFIGIEDLDLPGKDTAFKLIQDYAMAYDDIEASLL